MRTRPITVALRYGLAVLFLGSLGAAYGCQPEQAAEQRTTKEPLEEEDMPSCAPDVTYRTVAKPFLDQYCRDCHSKAAADAGAKVPHVFTNEASVRELGLHIYEALENEVMPPLEDEPELPTPSFKERKAMLEWLECSGATAVPEDDHEGHE